MTDDEVTPKANADGTPATPFTPPPVSRGLRQLANDLWHQKPGSRAPKADKPLPANQKEIVNGLDRREFWLGVGFSGISVALSIAGYFVNRHAVDPNISKNAGTYMVAGLVGGILLVIGTALRRRALLGFAAFFLGFELLSSKATVYGVIYLGFGGWLIIRVIRKQKQDQAKGINSKTVDTKPESKRAAGVPKPSKRYTPPRKTRSAAGRNR